MAPDSADDWDRKIEGILAREHRALLVSMVDGKHFSEHVDSVKRLKRERRYAEAEALLLRLQAAAEAWADVMNTDTPPAYAEHLRIVRKKIAAGK